MLHTYPIDLHVCPRSKSLHQFSGVLLDVADGVELKLQLAERQPVKARGSFRVQLRYSLDHLALTKGEVFEHAVLVVGFTNLRRRMWRPRKLTDELIFLSMLGPRSEGLLGVLKIEMRIEEGMVGDVPEPGLVIRTIPDRVGTSGNRLLEHFESGLVLGNDDL